MKYLTIYKSVLLSWLKHNLRLNLTIIIISVLSVLAFVTCFTFSAATDSAVRFYTEDHYAVGINPAQYDYRQLFLNSFPKIKYIETDYANAGEFYYSDGEHNSIRAYPFYVRFPKDFEQLTPAINEYYQLTDGRELTDEEAGASDVIIASNSSMLKVGQKITVPSLDNAELTVIGLADKFILPYGFYAKHPELSMPSINVIFDKPLSDEEISAAANVLGTPVALIKGEPNGSTAVGYIIALGAAVLSAVFSALQIFLLFLHLASKSYYQFSVFRITGCKNTALVFIMLAVTLTYILAAFLLTLPLIAPLSNILSLCGMNGIVGIRDIILSFVIFALAVMLAVLPGYIRSANRSMLKGGA